MVEKEGTDGEEDAMKAYKAAREESEQDSDVAVRDDISSALVDRASLPTLPLLMSRYMFSSSFLH